MKARTDDVKDIMAKLETGISEMFASDRYADWVRAMSRFHNYSLNNTMLILMQRPDATRVAGYKTWESLKRHVKKGEHGIKILAPCPHKKVVKDDAGNEEVVVWTTYRAVSVFDISQTDGDPLPTIYNGLLSGGVDGYNEMIDRLINIAPVPVDFEDDVRDGAAGYYSKAEGRIVVKSGMSEMQTVKTLCHEIAHSIMHSGDCKKDRATKEVEAESVAFALCNHYGIDTSDYSLSYVAGWSVGKDIKILRASMDDIRKATSDLIGKIDAAEPLRVAA